MVQARRFHMVRVPAQTVEKIKQIICRELPILNNQDLPISFYINYALKYFIMQNEKEQEEGETES